MPSFAFDCRILSWTLGTGCKNQNESVLTDWLGGKHTELYARESICFAGQNQNQNCFLVKRQNDSHSPGPEPGRLVPSSSHQRSELSNTILGTFSRGNKRVWKCIPIPNGRGVGGGAVGGEATLITNFLSVLAMGTWYAIEWYDPCSANQWDKVIFWYTGFTLQTFVCQYESPPFLEGFPF